MTDMINHPPHYNQNKIETIDIILDITKNLPGDQGYLAGNIIKYMSRYHFKNGAEDVKKARWYINKLINILADEQEEHKALDIKKIVDHFRAEVSE